MMSQEEPQGARPVSSPAAATGKAPALVWDSAHRRQRVHVFGAGRAVGREVVLELLRAGHPPELLGLYGRRAHQFSWKGKRIDMHPLHGDLPGCSIAFLCTPLDVARKLVPMLGQSGARVVDLSGSQRGVEGCLVSDGSDGLPIGPFSELACVPDRTAVIIARTLGVLERSIGLVRLDVFALVAAATHGERGMTEVREELRVAAGAQIPPALPTARRVGNLLPPLPDPSLGHARSVGAFEQVLSNDVRELLSRPDLPIDLMALQTDVERCDALAFKVGLRGPVDPGRIGALFAAEPGIRLDASEGGPVPAACAGSPEIHVGRIRAGSEGAGSLCFFAVGDQLRSGAALPALRIAAQMP